MNYKPLQIGDLIAERPIVQGGMGVGISLGNLAGAVAKKKVEWELFLLHKSGLRKRILKIIQDLPTKSNKERI